MLECRCQRIVAGGHFQAEHGGQQVLGQDSADAAGQGFGQGDARNRAVLHALAAGALHHQQAARFQVEHRLLFGASHQRFGAGSRGEADFDAARGVGGSEESLGPRGIIAIDEGLLGAIDGKGFGVAGQPFHRQAQAQRFFD